MYVLVLAAVGTAAVYLFMIMPRMTKRKQMKLFMGQKWAHRGLHCVEKGIPENSMAAFKQAVKEGYGIELDVHLTKDGRLVVFHDDTLKRVCGKEGRIEDMSYEELQQCYLSGTSEKIPLFSSVLSYIKGRVPLLIEVKLPSQNTDICVHLEDQLRGYTGPYLIQSFNCLVLRWLKKYRKDILRGQLSSNLVKSDHSPHYILRFCVKYLLSNCITRPDFISYKLKDSRNVSLLVLHSLLFTPVAVWTLRTAQAMEQAVKQYDMYIFEGIRPCSRK